MKLIVRGVASGEVEAHSQVLAEVDLKHDVPQEDLDFARHKLESTFSQLHGQAVAVRYDFEDAAQGEQDDTFTDEVVTQLTADIETGECSTFRITHHYDIGNQDVFVTRRTGNVHPLRAALYCQFKSEQWFDESSALTNMGIAAMLVMHYGFRQAAATEACATIDMYRDREAACGTTYSELMADVSLHREGLRESMTNFFD